MLKKIVKMLMCFPENCIFVKIVTFGGKAIVGTAKIFPSIVIYSLTYMYDRKTA